MAIKKIIYHPSKEDVAEYDAFFRAVGECLSIWNHAEAELEQIFGAVIGVSSDFALSNAFWSVHSVEARLKMVDEAVRTVFQDREPAWSAWKTARNRMRDLNDKRNEIAHGTVTRWNTKSSNNIREWEIVLIPYYFASLSDHRTWAKVKEDPEAKLQITYRRIPELERIGADFDALAPLLHNVYRLISKEKMSSEEYRRRFEVGIEEEHIYPE